MMRVVYVIDSLASRGGAERIVTEKAGWLAERFGYDVTIVTCYQMPATNPNVYRLSAAVRQVDLAVPYYSQYSVGYPRRLWVKWRLYRRLRRQLRQTLATLSPDAVVAMGYFNADLVCEVAPEGTVRVVESHEARQFSMADSGLARSRLSRLFMRYFRNRYFSSVERNADVAVTLTKGDAGLWCKAHRVEIIPDFSAMPVAGRSDLHSHRVIAVGRLEWQKGYDRLLDAWAIVARSHRDWQLDIFGSGTLEADIRRRMEREHLDNVCIHPFTMDIGNEYMRSSLCVLASRFEGFSLVLLEAMRHGLPCVAFDCPYGPSDVVADGQCGFVVSNGDIEALAGKMSLLMDDPQLRRQMGAEAIGRAAIFSPDNIMQQWKRLFESLRS